MSSLSIPLAGMIQAETQLSATGKRIPKEGGSPDTSVSLIEAKSHSDVSVAAERAMDQMRKNTIDMYA